MAYELLKKHKEYGWCLEFVFLSKDSAIAELETRKTTDPEGEYQIFEDKNPWYYDPTNF